MRSRNEFNSGCGNWRLINHKTSDLTPDGAICRTSGFVDKVMSSHNVRKNCVLMDLRRHFFSERIVNIWNKLQEGIVSAPSANSLNKLNNCTRMSHFQDYTYPLDSEGRASPLQRPHWWVTGESHNNQQHWDSLFPGDSCESEFQKTLCLVEFVAAPGQSSFCLQLQGCQETACNSF